MTPFEIRLALQAAASIRPLAREGANICRRGKPRRRDGPGGPSEDRIRAWEDNWLLDADVTIKRRRRASNMSPACSAADGSPIRFGNKPKRAILLRRAEPFAEDVGVTDPAGAGRSA